MKTIMRNLTGTILVTAAVLGTGRSQELRLNDIKAQQSQETIVASAPCQQAQEAPQGWVNQPYVIDPKTLVQDLNTLMDQSDEVILARLLDARTVISPSGESTATYVEARVIRNWKGRHLAGDTLTFGVPWGEVSCEPTGGQWSTFFDVDPDDFGVPASEPFDWVVVLFLRQSKGDEAQLVQGLRLVAGEGAQGMFTIEVPTPTASEPERECSGQHWSWQRCDAYLEDSQIPVVVPYSHDPLAKKFGGMPTSQFLCEVQAIASGQRVAKESSLK